MKAKNFKNVADYLDLPYHFVTQKIVDESGTYFHISVAELPYCQSHGDTIEEAAVNIREAMEGWIKVHLEDGDTVPMPIEENNYSGKFNVRVPKSLHARLAMEAKREGVSLNQLAVHKLSLAL
jgi:predicted RNase H-like HicB family nuclease